MIFIKNFTPSNFQISQIISESILSTPLSQNGVWKDRMIDLDLGSTGTNTDSKKWLKSSKGSGVEIGSGSGSKSSRWNSSPHSFSNNGMWLNIGNSSSRMIGMGIKTDSKILLKFKRERVQLLRVRTKWKKERILDRIWSRFPAKEEWERVQLFYTNLLSSSFFPSLFEIPFG